VNTPEPLIADALREIAAEAPAPRTTAAAAWQAGRRRRWRGLAAAVTAGAGAIAAVIALTLAVTDSPARPAGGPPSVALAPVTLFIPIQFRQVASISMHACKAGSPGVPGPATAPAASPNPPGDSCYQLSHTGITVTELKSVAVIRSVNGNWVVDIQFTRGDAARFAALTRELVGQESPRDQLAVVVGGRIISSPVVVAPITGGQAQIPGFASRAQAENLLRHA
jgi:SecDF, P1 head subdomain